MREGLGCGLRPCRVAGTGCAPSPVSRCAGSFRQTLSAGWPVRYAAGLVACGSEPQQTLLGQILDQENMERAWSRMRANKGKPGIDGMSVKEFPAFLQVHIRRIIDQIREGHPFVADESPRDQPNRHLWIRMSGGVGGLLSDGESYPDMIPFLFRSRTGLPSDFFRLNHRIGGGGQDRPTTLVCVAQKVTDKRVLKLIRKYLECGVMVDGLEEAREEGTPQGGPLSPLLSNIVLDELDKELEKRALKFVRYADDCVVYVGSKRAGERVKESITKFITKRLRLKVNEASLNKAFFSW